jgi:glycosyltransferase involved in cell wall biosynthesis
VENSPPPRFSVLMCVYNGEKSTHFQAALTSIAAQSRLDFEFVLVKDGQLRPELESIVSLFSERLAIKTISLPVQSGLSNALNCGLAECSHEIVIRCDSDDLNLPSRFERQFEYLSCNKDIDIISAPMIEFEDNGNTFRFSALRIVPQEHKEIVRLALFRNPFNHPSTAFRKSAVMSVGGYPVDSETKMEDYALWLRMFAARKLSANLTEPLVLFRGGREFITRRSGLKYIRDEFKFISVKVETGTCSYFLGLMVAIARSIPRLLPVALLDKIYFYGLRQDIHKDLVDEETIAQLGFQICAKGIKSNRP